MGIERDSAALGCRQALILLVVAVVDRWLLGVAQAPSPYPGRPEGQVGGAH